MDVALAAKGWTEVESGGDISIIAIEINRDHQTLNTYYDDFGGGWRWRGFGGFGESTTTFDSTQLARCCRSLRCEDQKLGLARRVQRRAFRQVRQEHQEPEQGSAVTIMITSPSTLTRFRSSLPTWLEKEFLLRF